MSRPTQRDEVSYARGRHEFDQLGVTVSQMRLERRGKDRYDIVIDTGAGGVVDLAVEDETTLADLVTYLLVEGVVVVDPTE